MAVCGGKECSALFALFRSDLTFIHQGTFSRQEQPMSRKKRAIMRLLVTHTALCLYFQHQGPPVGSQGRCIWTGLQTRPLTTRFQHTCVQIFKKITLSGGNKPVYSCFFISSKLLIVKIRGNYPVGEIFKWFPLKIQSFKVRVRK